MHPTPEPDAATYHRKRKRSTRNRTHDRVYAYLLTQIPRGATFHEIGKALDMPLQSVTPAVCRLRKDDKAESTGERTMGPHGRRCRLWRAL